ncbi:uncharacterized protein [Eucyclogobius newberryi]|uniref:uncharacterized protein n=1 Tax=Eucyclogobius newberryi TaxID=166745 RepID=UPI003B5B91FA
MVPSMHRFDLSKVEPRVRFPKDGYTPPKSRCPLRSVSLSPEPRLMYMSPANIVAKVLLNPLYEPDPKDKEETQGVRYILPPEFRSEQQAISLMIELQEDNYRLKLKFAEAATTIDWLRQKVEASERSLQTEQQMEKMLQRLDILERCYMFAKEEHKRLQREGAHLGNFDPERELESLIFQCDQQMDELKEQVQQKQLYNVATPTHHDPPTHQDPPPPPLQTPPTPSHAAVQVPEHKSPLSSTSSSVRRFSDLIDALRSQAQMFLQNVEACGRSLQTEKQMELVFGE